MPSTDPGVSPGGVMWNTAIPTGSVQNSLKMKWSVTARKKSVNDCADAFRGDFFENTATIAVTAFWFQMRRVLPDPPPRWCSLWRSPNRLGQPS
jgi:hypothetical protein